MQRPVQPRKTLRKTYDCSYESVQTVVDHLLSLGIPLKDATFDYETHMYSDERHTVVEYNVENPDYKAGMKKYKEEMVQWDALEISRIVAQKEALEAQKEALDKRLADLGPK